MVYADSSKPELVEGFIKNTFTAMIEGVEKDALNNTLIDKYEWDQGIKDLYRRAEKDGVFCYTFLKGKVIKKSFLKSREVRTTLRMRFSPCRSLGLRHVYLRFAPANVAYAGNVI